MSASWLLPPANSTVGKLAVVLVRKPRREASDINWADGGSRELSPTSPPMNSAADATTLCSTRCPSVATAPNAATASTSAIASVASSPYRNSRRSVRQANDSGFMPARFPPVFRHPNAW